MCFCDFRHLFGKPPMSWLRSKHEVQECWPVTLCTCLSKQSISGTNKHKYWKTSLCTQYQQAIKHSPSNFKIWILMTLLSALSGWCFICFFKGNMKASELKNPNKPNKKPTPTNPPSKTDSVQFYNILLSFKEQKNILRVLKNCASKITCPRWF